MAATGRKAGLDVIRAPVEQRCVDLEGYFRDYLRTDVPVIDRIFEHLLDGGGKRFRPLLVLLISSFDHDVPEEDIYRLAVAVEFIHTATLLHDDVVDQSDMRRGNRVAYRLWGAEPSVLSGDYLYSRAFSLLVDIGHLGILDVISNATTAMARGEVLQLLRSFSTATSRDEYMEVIKGKTASLISASCKAAGYLSRFNGEDLDSLAGFGMNLGYSFQIIDDILDYTADRGDLGKAIGKDFLEGKVTLPIIFLLQDLNGDLRKEVADVFLKETPDPDDFEMVLDLMKQKGTLERSQSFAEEFSLQAAQNLEKLPPGQIQDSLQALARYVVERRR